MIAKWPRNRGHLIFNESSSHMNNHYEVCITAESEMQALLVAELSLIDYEGFEESDAELKAYVPEALYNENLLNELLKKYDLTCSLSIIEKKNWNQLWESNFEPVQVDDFVGIRAGFHPGFTGVQHEIVITPKMSFGTGHHATTWMVMKLMQELDFAGKSVFDFGTGTGILAILAEKLGAASVLGVDNDDWCVENASENIGINSCRVTDIEKTEVLFLDRKFDVMLANINRNIILENLVQMVGGVKAGGDILLSGLLESDEADILDACRKQGLIYHKTLKRNGWVAIRLSGQ